MDRNILMKDLMEKFKVSTRKLADATGINYGKINRFKNGQLIKVDEDYENILKYFYDLSFYNGINNVEISSLLSDEQKELNQIVKDEYEKICLNNWATQEATIEYWDKNNKLIKRTDENYKEYLIQSELEYKLLSEYKNAHLEEFDDEEYEDFFEVRKNRPEPEYIEYDDIESMRNYVALKNSKEANKKVNKVQDLGEFLEEFRAGKIKKFKNGVAIGLKDVYENIEAIRCFPDCLIKKMYELRLKESKDRKLKEEQEKHIEEKKAQLKRCAKKIPICFHKCKDSVIIFLMKKMTNSSSCTEKDELYMKNRIISYKDDFNPVGNNCIGFISDPAKRIKDVLSITMEEAYYLYIYYLHFLYRKIK